MLWGLLKRLNLSLVLLLINCVTEFFLLSQNGVYCAKTFIVNLFLPLFKPFRSCDVQMPANTCVNCKND